MTTSPAPTALSCWTDLCNSRLHRAPDLPDPGIEPLTGVSWASAFPGVDKSTSVFKGLPTDIELNLATLLGTLREGKTSDCIAGAPIRSEQKPVAGEGEGEGEKNREGEGKGLKVTTARKVCYFAKRC